MQSVFFGWVVGKIPAVCRLITCRNAHKYIYIYTHFFVITFILTWCWYIYHTHVREYIFVHLTQGAYISGIPELATCGYLPFDYPSPKDEPDNVTKPRKTLEAENGSCWCWVSFLGGHTEWMVQNTKRPTKLVVGLVPQFWSHGYMILS